MRQNALLPLATLFALAMAAAPAAARPGSWGGAGWGDDGWGSAGGFGLPRNARRPGPDRSREGRVQVERFVAPDIAAGTLGHGAITVAVQPDDADFMAGADRAVFEAAVIDQLVHAGYDTTRPDPADGQVTELRVLRRVLDNGEPPHGPVSGEAAISVGNRGTAYGLAVAVDLTKPLPPLVSTRLDARILDRASGKVLWEGHADVATREGDAGWSQQTIAGRLAEALFANFPRTGQALAAAHP